VFTITEQPTDGETVIINGIDYTFRDTVTDTTSEVEIGDTLTETLDNLATTITTSENDVVDSCMIADPDIPSLTIFMVKDGVSTTEVCAHGSFDVATSTGASGKRQSLEFPRDELYDKSSGEEIIGIPELLKNATCEYAHKASTVTLAPDPSVDNTVSSISTTVGPISKSVSYVVGNVTNPIQPFPSADRLLQEYVRSSTSIIRD
jgi:hypothetical protein